MKRKLLLLNVVLLAATAAAGWRLRVEWRAGKAREAAAARRAVKPLPPPPFSPLPAAPPVQPVAYADIAQKMLFAKDRNPVVVVDAVPAPPPKPMPPLPVLFGVMDLDGPLAIMAEKAGAVSRELRPGQTMGEFKLLAVDSRQVVFEWDGKRIERMVDDLVYRRVEGNEPAEQTRSGAPAPPAGQSAPAPPPQQPQGRPEPGADVGKGFRACQAGDNSPPGTVSQGMRKVITDSPFGQVCRWEPADR